MRWGVFFPLTDDGLIFGASAAAGSANVQRRLALLHALVPPVANRIVDIGAGEGSYAVALYRRGLHLTLVDVLPAPLEKARHRFTETVGAETVTFLCAPAESTGLPDAAFEAAYMIEVLDHVRDPAAAVQEAARLLAPGGRLYLTVPNRAFPIETHPVRWFGRLIMPWWMPFLPWCPPLHRRLATARVFTPGDLRALAAGAGLVLEGMEPMMPPFERFPALQGLSALIGRTGLRWFGVSLCAVMRRG